MPEIHVGSRVSLNYQCAGHGIVSEIVPPNCVPRTVRHSAAWRRPVTSYVVTVLVARTMAVPGRQGARSYTLAPRRIWPDPATLRLCL